MVDPARPAAMPLRIHDAHYPSREEARAVVRGEVASPGHAGQDGALAGQSLEQLSKATAPARVVTVAETAARRISRRLRASCLSAPVPTLGSGVRTCIGTRAVRRAVAVVLEVAADAISALDADDPSECRGAQPNARVGEGTSPHRDPDQSWKKPDSHAPRGSE
jgi:hypothetical protein